MPLLLPNNTFRIQDAGSLGIRSHSLTHDVTEFLKDDSARISGEELAGV